jgi:type I restriction enzyme M protein
LWDAACTIRGPLDAPKFKDYILPLIFLKRLSGVFDDEVAHLAHEFGDKTTAAKLVRQDHKLVRFCVPEKARYAFLLARGTWSSAPGARRRPFMITAISNRMGGPCPRKLWSIIRNTAETE